MTRILRGTLLFVFSGIVTFHITSSAVAPTLIVANGSSIVQIDTNTYHKTVLYDNLQRAVAVAVDVGDGLLFWTDVDTASIYRGSIDGLQAEQEIITDLGRPNGIAVDWLSDNIYWTDAILGSIEVAKNDGRFRRTLLYGLSNPRSIAVDPNNGYMYWTDQDSDTVESARLDGSNPQSLVNTGLYWPNEIVLDSQRKLYWIDGKHHTIQSLQDGAGNQPNQVVNLTSTSDEVMFGLALHGSTLFFSVWTEGAIYSVSVSGTNVRSVASGFGEYVFGLAVSDSSVQPETGNECSSQPSYCSQLCLPTSATTKTCACSSYDELTLMSDGRTCGIAEEFLLYCAGYDGQIRLLALDGHASGRSIVIDQTSRCVALDYDPEDQIIYYSDVSVLEIRRVDLTGNNSQTFLQQGVGLVDGIAIDTLHRRLYFTNWNTLYATNTGDEWARIEMVDLDGRNRKRIIESGLYRPRSIQLDVQAGHLYYSDWGLNSGIIRTDLDGKNPVVIHSENVENPNGLVLTDSKLYFVDSHYSSGAVPSLESSNLDGTNRNTITHNFPMRVPFGLDVKGDSVYWSDWNATAIYKGDLVTGDVRKLVGGIIDPMVVKYATRTYIPNTGPDRCLNSVCTGICVHAPAGTTRCLCPDKGGKVLSDNGFQCIAPSKFMLVADVYDIRMVGLDTSDRQAYPVVTATQDDNIVAIAYDSQTNLLYWSSVHYGTIQRINFFTADAVPEDFFMHGEIIDGMTIDSNTLYWTDYGLKTIEKMSLSDSDGSTHEVLLSNISSPRAIIVHNGYLYFTDWTVGDASVQRLNLNTRVLTTIIQDNLKKPNGLAISNNKLYVIDGEELKVMKSDLDGANQETLVYLNSKFNHAYDLEVVGDYLIFSDWNDKAVYLSNMDNRRLSKFVTNLNRPTELVIQGDINECASSPCMNGGTCQIGQNTGTYTCDCPQGWTGTHCETGIIGTTPTPGPVSFRLCPAGIIELSVGENNNTAYLDVDIEAIDSNGRIIEHEVIGDIQIPSTIEFNDQTKDGINVNVRAAVGQQEAWCQFQIKVVDPHPPKITFCPPDQSQTTSGDKVKIEWSPPTATDNTELHDVVPSRQSGSKFTVQGSPHLVTVTATDTSGNIATCSFKIAISHSPPECPDLEVPWHGSLSCGNILGGFQCVVHCKNGYQPFKDRDVYTCNVGIWHPQDGPRCSQNIPGQAISQTVVFIYQSACGIVSYKEEIINQLQNNLEEHKLCHKKDHRRVCDQESFVIVCGSGNRRRKRQAADDLTVQFKVQIINDADDVPSDDSSLELLNDMKMNMNESIAGIEQLLKNGSLDLEINGQTIESNPDYFTVSQPEWICFEGHVSTVDGCVPCPVGTMYEASDDDCTFCPIGTYQEDEAQLQCLECKDGEYTDNIGSFRESHCLKKIQETSSSLVIVIACVVVGLVLLIVVVMVIVICLRRKNQKSAGQRSGNSNEGYEGAGFEHLRRVDTKKLRTAMYSDQEPHYFEPAGSTDFNNENAEPDYAELNDDSNYTALSGQQKNEYMELDLKTRDELKPHDLLQEETNTFFPTTSDDKL